MSRAKSESARAYRDRLAEGIRALGLKPGLEVPEGEGSLNGYLYPEEGREPAALVLLDAHEVWALDCLYLKVDLVLIAERAGTLCLMVDLAGVERVSGEALEKRVAEAVSSALQLRQAALRQAQRSERRQELGVAQFQPLAWMLELVFDLSGCGSVAEREGLHREVFKLLSRVATRSDALKHLGINLLGSHEQADLKQAFPWLLCRVDEWARHAKEKKGAEAIARLSKICLHQFRLPQDLRLDLDERAFHLIHGWNGSGKSTLAEAIELAFTNRSSRTGEQSLGGAVYRPMGKEGRELGKPEVELHVKCGEERGRYYWRFGEGEENEGLPAFLLHQGLMDKLIHSSDSERAELILRKFFPDASRVPQEYAEAKTACDKAREKYEALVEKAGARAELEPWASFDAERWEGLGLFPIGLEELERLALLEEEGRAQSSLRNLLARWRGWRLIVAGEGKLPELEEVYSLLGELKKRLDELMKAKAELEKGKRLLLRYRGWQPQSAREREDWSVLLDRWIVSHVRYELANQFEELQVAMAKARELRWENSHPGEESLAWLSEKPILEEGREQLAQMRVDREQAFDRLAKVDTKKEGEEVRQGAREPLSYEEQALLDKLGVWLLGSGSEAGDSAALGFGIASALSSGQHVHLGEVTIGASGWAEWLLSRLDEPVRLLAALAEAAEDWDKRPKRAAEFVRKYEELATEQERLGKRLEEVESELRKTLDEVTGELRFGEALEELVALFTPARFNYRKPEFKMSEDGRNVSLTLADGVGLGEAKAGGAAGRQELPINLIWNTAELNILALSLFLLNSFKLRPLRMWTRAMKLGEGEDGSGASGGQEVMEGASLGFLVFDDPLQNMDELSVISLARGLARLQMAELLPFQLLLLLHSAENVRHFSEELADFALYRMEWLNTGQEEKSEEGKEKQRVPSQIKREGTRSLRSRRLSVNELFAVAECGEEAGCG